MTQKASASELMCKVSYEKSSSLQAKHSQRPPEMIYADIFSLLFLLSLGSTGACVLRRFHESDFYNARLELLRKQKVST